MAELGEVRRAKELGYKGTNAYLRHPCVDCGKQRWVVLRGGKPKNLRCRRCAARRNDNLPHGTGENNLNWKGGKRKDSDGYILIFAPEHPCADKNGCVRENRLIAEQALGRYLLRTEIAHHRNGIRDDDSRNNIEVLASTSDHMKIHSRTRHRDKKGQFIEKG